MSESDRHDPCNDEFERYEKYRAELVKGQLEGEKNYDTTLVTLSTVAIGASFTVVKDLHGGLLLIGCAWFFLSVCLFIALIDRLQTYLVHKKTREIFDRHFGNWTTTGVGTWDAASAEANGLFRNKYLHWLKWICFGSLLLGVAFLMLAVAGRIEQNTNIQNQGDVMSDDKRRDSGNRGQGHAGGTVPPPATRPAPQPTDSAPQPQQPKPTK